MTTPSVYIFADYNRTYNDNANAAFTLDQFKIYSPLTMNRSTFVGNVTITMPTAAQIVAGHKSLYGVAYVNDIYRFSVYRTGAGTTTLGGAPAGVTYYGPTVAANSSIQVTIELRNVTAGQEACNVYYGAGII